MNIFGGIIPGGPPPNPALSACGPIMDMRAARGSPSGIEPSPSMTGGRGKALEDRISF